MNSVDNANHEGVYTSCLCLSPLSEGEINKAIDELLHHHFLGVYNMGIERKYLKKYDDIAGTKKDIENRLAHTLLFILEPDLIDVDFRYYNKVVTHNLGNLIRSAHTISGTRWSTTALSKKFGTKNLNLPNIRSWHIQTIYA